MIDTPYYSVVIPLKNEEGNIEKLVDEVSQSMDALGKLWEFICIDDGSTDNSYNKLCKLRARCPQLRILRLKSNVGQSGALKAGFEHAKAPWIITLDADLQNDPSDISKLCQLEGSYDIICGYRQQRKDTWQKRIISRVANAIRNWLCHDGVQDTGCSLKLIRADALKRIFWFRGAHRFMPALFRLNGFTLAQVPVSHRSRFSGTSHYHIFNRGLAPITDMLAMIWLRRRHLRYEISNEDPHAN